MFGIIGIIYYMKHPYDIPRDPSPHRVQSQPRRNNISIPQIIPTRLPVDIATKIVCDLGNRAESTQDVLN